MRAAPRCSSRCAVPSLRAPCVPVRSVSTRTSVVPRKPAFVSVNHPAMISYRSAMIAPSSITLRNYHATPPQFKKGGKDKDDKKGDKGRGGVDQLELDTDDLKQKMDRAIDSLKQDLANIRTGRANPAILDKVQVVVDGSSHSILSLGQISVKDANTLLVTAYAEEHAKPIREAIEKSKLGLIPQQDQRFVLIPVPKATQEYRDQLKAQVSKVAEQAKQRVRNVRKGGLDELKRIEKQMSKDKFKSTEKEVQNITDKYTANIESLCKAKEKDIASF